MQSEQAAVPDALLRWLPEDRHVLLVLDCAGNGMPVIRREKKPPGAVDPELPVSQSVEWLECPIPAHIQLLLSLPGWQDGREQVVLPVQI